MYSIPSVKLRFEITPNFLLRSGVYPTYKLKNDAGVVSWILAKDKKLLVRDEGLCYS